MRPIAVIAHIGRAVIGAVADVGAARQLSFEMYRPYEGQGLPDLPEVEAVVVLGGPQGAYEIERYPYLLDEERYLADAVAAGVPVLAICLGSQILARALGGSAEPGANGLEAGFIHVRPVNAATNGDICGEFFSFHSDTMTPPAHAEILATSDHYVQAWRAGSALAVQFHPEMTLEGVHRLLSVEDEKLAAYGVDVPALRSEAERYFTSPANNATRLLANWFESFAPEFPSTTSPAKEEDYVHHQ